LRTAKVLACCLLVFPFVGTVPRSGPRARTQSLASSGEAPVCRAAASAFSLAGSWLFPAGRYLEAQQLFEAARAAAIEGKSPGQVARNLGNIGACQLALHQYRPALESLLEAHRQAEGGRRPQRGRNLGRQHRISLL
jgi:hypothetical protein